MMRTKNLVRICLATLSITSGLNSNAQDEAWSPVGSGSEEYPYQISSFFDLYNYAQRIEKIENYSKGKFFVLTSDISMQDATILDKDGNLVADTTKLAKWNPIGTEWYGKSFAGTFDGQGHTISGIYVDARNHKYSGYAGLFGHMSGTIKNLTITNSYFCGGSNIGAFAGQMNGDDALIENCVNYASVSGEKSPTMQIGGFFGYTYYGSVKNCKNYGKITLNPEPDEWGGMWDCSAGGIGGSGGSISNCENRGSITSYNWGGIGGIVGSPRYVSNCMNYGNVEDFHGNSIGGINGWSGSIWDCENHGMVVSHAKGAKIGGISGIISSGGRIGNCKNFTPLDSSESDVWIGGICGYGDIDGYTETYITGCSNLGNVSTSSELSHCAGIVPYLYHAEVRTCKNYGNVKSESEAGGICALAMAHGSISNSENHANVTGRGLLGGITAQAVQAVHGCVNFGEIELLSGSRVGGIVGYMSSSSSYTIDCANLGKVVTHGNSMIGGIVGNSSSYGTVRCSYNSGDIVSFGDSWMGGIAGYMANGIYDCYNKGNIVNYGNGSCLAGIAGWSNSSIENAFTTGYLYCLGDNETVGNMVSGTYTSIDGYARKKNLYYSNIIVGNPSKHSNSSSAWTFNHIEEKDIANLTDIFNESKSYGESGGWMTGYFHPVIKRYYATEDSNYNDPEYNYSVTTLTGDSCRIDLGIPFDNTFFTTTQDDNSVYCKNTIFDGNNVKSLWIVDNKNFILPMDIEVEMATMRLNDIDRFCAKILPWNMDENELPDGITLYSFQTQSNDETATFEKCNQIVAGKAILIEIEDSLKEVSFKLYDKHLSIPHEEKGIFEGSFVDAMATQDQYVLNSADGKFIRCSDGSSIKAFDAYMYLESCDSDIVNIDLSGLSGVQNPLQHEHSFELKKIGELVYEITGLSSCADFAVYDVTGRKIHNNTISGQSSVIELSSHGIYIIMVGEEVLKVRL